MEKSNLAIATIAWARNEDEEQVLALSLEALAGLGLPLFVTDGGSSNAFLDRLRQLPGVQVQAAKGLWPQAKTSILAAAQTGAQMILYTEPDKEQFFRHHLHSMLTESSRHKAEGVLLASRSAKAYATFPAFQQQTESTINHSCREVIGREGDYCYGPFLFSANLIPALHRLPPDCGWGWRPFLFATAHQYGLPVQFYAGDFDCPLTQRQDDADERIYRMRQLVQNIEGLILAVTPVPPKNVSTT